MAYHETQLDKYLDRAGYRVVEGGEYTAFDLFLRDFHAFLTAKNLDPAEWPAERVRRDLDRGHTPIGPGPQNKLVIGNLTKQRSVPVRYVKTEDGRVRLS